MNYDNQEDYVSHHSETTSIDIDRLALIDPVSFEPFDTTENYPIALPCGHTLSAITFETLKRSRDLKCPQCRHIFQDNIFYSRNVILNNILKQPKKSKCPEHLETIKRACLNCYKPLCIDCMTNHTGHNVVKLRDLKEQMEKRLQNLKNSQLVREGDIKVEIQNFVQKTSSNIENELRSFATTFFEKNRVPAFSQQLEDKITENLQHEPESAMHSLKLIKNWDEEYNNLMSNSQKSIFCKKDVVKKLNSISGSINMIIKELLYPGEIKIKEDDEYESFADIFNNETEENLQQRFKDHKSFTLDASLFRNAIDDSELRKLSILLKNIPNLQQLDLKLCSDTVHTLAVTDKGITDLASCIKRFNSLINVGIDFNSANEILDEGFIEFAFSLKQIAQTCQSLSLNFRKCNNITDASIQCLSKSLKEFTNLKQISLDFQECLQITDKGLIELSQAFLNLNNLQQIDLYFGAGLLDSSQVSDLSLSNLFKNLDSLINLSSLNLQFTCSEKVSDYSIIQLSESLLNKERLEKIHLEFGCCPMITDKSLIKISNSLKTLKQITDLTLEFSGCYQIGDDSLKEICFMLRQLGALHELSLGFVGCKEITSKGIQDLHQATDCLPFLANKKLAPNKRL